MDCSCPKNFFVFFLLSLLPFPLERRNKLGITADIRNVKGTLLYGNSGAQQSSSLTRAHQSDERLWAAGLERVVGNRWGTGSGGWWGVRCHSFDYQELMLHTAQSRPAPPRTNPRWVVQFCRQFWISRRRMFANLKEKTKNPRQFFQQCVTSVTSILYRECGSGWVGIYFFFFFLTWLSRSTINCAHALSTPATYWVKAVYV
jgi:hypothetical protein